MPISISKSSEYKKQRIRLDLGDLGDINATAYPNRITIALEQKLNAAIADGDTATVAAEFSQIIADWDVTDDDGNVLPINEETISMLGIPLVAELFQVVQETLSPKAKTGKQ